MNRGCIMVLAGWVMAALSAPAEAGPLGLGLPAPLPAVTGALGTVTSRTTGLLNQSAGLIAQDAGLLRDAVGRPNTVSPSSLHAVEKDANGFRVVRAEVLALSPTDKSLAIARSLDFEILRQESLDSLGLTVAVLRVPGGMSASEGLDALRKADPAGAYDVDHIYDPSGTASVDTQADAPSAPAALQGPIRIGMIDGGLDRRHDAFEHAAIVTQGFVGTASPVATKHGTAVASLLVGADDDVSGALPGATLYAADVYCGQAAGGSADAIVRALSWFAANDVPVVNISLAGPPNAVLGAAVSAFAKRGHVLVAAVGNDGPAAPVEYPAGYPGVVGVTSVDDKHAVQLEADRGPDVAFAARGVGVSVASLNGRHDSMTGTSFAVPIVAARFALLLPRADPHLVPEVWDTLERAALHLGPPGRNDIYGYGFLDRPPALLSATAEK